MVLNGLAAAALFAMALQKGGPTGVTAIMFTTNTTLSSFVGLVYLDDHVRDRVPGWFAHGTPHVHGLPTGGGEK